MEKTIISNWNSRVSKNDEVYILGDMFWRNDEAPRILSELKGRKYLILGNHDRVNAEMAKHFVWCNRGLEMIKDEGQKVVLCHFPIAHWDGQMHTPQTIHLYGHIHQGRDTRPFEQYVKVWEEAARNEVKQAKKLSSSELIEMIQPVFVALVKAKYKSVTLSIVEQYLGVDDDGKPRKVSEAEETDVDALQCIYDNLVNFAEEKNVEWED